MTWIEVDGACLDCIYSHHDRCDGWFPAGTHKHRCRCGETDHRLPIVTASGVIPPADTQKGT